MAKNEGKSKSKTGMVKSTRSIKLPRNCKVNNELVSNIYADRDANRFVHDYTMCYNVSALCEWLDRALSLT